MILALAATGLIWSRYSTQIVPVNYNLLSVNLFVGATGFYQLYRIWEYRRSLPVAEQSTPSSTPAAAAAAAITK
jgi:hypothetical protein